MTKAEQTRQRIIEESAHLLNVKGIAGTTIDDVLNTTKVAKGCLYGHFENKEALSLATVDYMLGKLAANTTERINNAGTSKQKLFAFIDMYQNPLVTIFNGGCPILNFAVESDDTSVELKKKIKQIIQKTLKQITAIIKNGIQKKEFKKTFNAEEFAIKCFGMIEGGIMICRSTNNISYMKTIIKMLKAEVETYSL